MRRPDERARERGAVSVVVAAVAALSLVMSLLVLDLWRAVIARARAQTAADAAALAAAGSMWSRDGPDPTAVASAYAERNGGTLEACECPEGGPEAVVTVRITFGVTTIPGAHRDVRATARAVVEGLGGPGAEGLRPWFAARLACLDGLVPGIALVSGFRTREEQARLHREKPGLAAPPGRSLHELGLAADLAFPSLAAAGRAHALAGGCGLEFGVPGEPWHASPIGWE
jgi:secretion/DNA translocation related TadE-like protein